MKLAPIALVALIATLQPACSSDNNGDDGGPISGLTFCDGATSLIYDPLRPSTDAFPDDFYSVEDDSTATGMRVHMVDGDNIVLPAAAVPFAKIWQDLSLLDGFGTNAEAFLIVSGALDDSTYESGEGSGNAQASIVLVNLDSDTPEFVDIEVTQVAESVGNDQTNLLISPMVPLRPKTRYGLAITTRAKASDGDCIAPSPTMMSLLDRSAIDPALSRLADRYDDLAARLIDAGTIEARGDLSAAVVFTTQHTVDDSVAIAQDIRGQAFTYERASTPCADSGKGYAICEGSFAGFDYRGSDGAVDESDLTARAPWTIPVTVYMPTTGEAPFRTMIYGHGLNGDRFQAERLATLAAPYGYAVVSIDAVEHGEHPKKSGGLASAIDFFGLQVLPSPSLDTRRLRDNFRQSTYDKLQLVEVLRPGVDVDGDDTDDIGIEDLTYLGVSLGGIMSAEFVALAPEVKVAVPIVPGARVANIIKDSATFSPLIGVLGGSSSDGDIARLFPLIQTAIDRGDAASYAGHMMSERLPGFDSGTPQTLMQMVIDDDTVPNGQNLYFARALGLPHVGDELLKVGVVDHVQALPVQGNFDATHTWGMYQFDLVCADDLCPATEMATHGNVAANPVAIEQSLHFIESFFTDGSSEIIDSYRTLDVKP